MRKLTVFGSSIIFMVGIGCHPEKTKLIQPAEIDFSTDDASELFFKNVRQLYYDKEVMKEEKLDIYRLKSRSIVEDQPVINLAIIINWRFDEAYLLIEPNQFLTDQEVFQIIWTDDQGESNQMVYEMGNKTSQHKFAAILYNGILSQQSFQIKMNQDTFTLLKDATQRESFRITCFDFLRLVGAR